jgi:hypothetical protein
MRSFYQKHVFLCYFRDPIKSLMHPMLMDATKCGASGFVEVAKIFSSPEAVESGSS